MAATLADLGCAVALASRTEADCADLAAGIAERFGVPAVGLSCNIADEASVEAAVAGTIDRLGGLDILINNAGASWWGLPQDIPLKGWQKVMDVNVKGIFFLFQKLIPLLRKSASPEDPARVAVTGGVDQVVFDGSGTQTVFFNDPGAGKSRFHDVGFENTSPNSVNPSSTIIINGQMQAPGHVTTVVNGANNIVTVNGGKCSSASVAIGGVEATPTKASAVESALVRSDLSDRALDAAAEAERARAHAALLRARRSLRSPRNVRSHVAHQPRSKAPTRAPRWTQLYTTR